MRGKLTDVCNDASGILNERPKFLAMGLALMLIHRDVELNPDAVVEEFSRRYHAGFY